MIKRRIAAAAAANQHPPPHPPHPDSYSYNIVLAAWADSGRPEAAERMDALTRRMRERGARPTTATYDIWLRYYCNNNGQQQQQPSIEHMERMLEEMREVGVVPDLTNLSHCVAAYAAHGQVRRAVELLFRMIDEYLLGHNINSTAVNHHHDQRALDKGVQSILRHYRDVVDSKAGSEAKAQALRDAVALAQKVQTLHALDAQSIGKHV